MPSVVVAIARDPIGRSYGFHQQRARYVHRLERLADAGIIGAVLPVAYDRRLSNRHNAHCLADLVEPALDRWPATTRLRADAQLVFVCHPMGGLIARWCIEQLGGQQRTRKLITLGTPYRGAAKAVDQLVNGVHKGLGRLAVDLTAFARSLPAAAAKGTSASR